MGSFIGAKVEAQRLNSLKSQYQFQSLILNAKKETITAKMGGIQASYSESKTKIDRWNNASEDNRLNLYKNDVNNFYHDLTKNVASDKIKCTQITVNSDYTSDKNYVQYEAEDEYIDTRIDNLESLLTLLDTQIKHTENLEQNGIKDNSWWCVGGGN